MKLIVTTSSLSDSSEEKYIGCHVKHTSIIRYLRVFRRMLGDEVYAYYRKQKRQRDMGVFHITVVNPIDYVNVKNKQLVLDQVFGVDLIGIGRSENAESITYYIIIECGLIQAYRESLGLPPSDLHITLGFSRYDLYGVAKGRDTMVNEVGELPLKSSYAME